MTALADQAARDAIRTRLDRTLVVEAAAGTGKTTALVGRIVEVVRTGAARLDEIVAVTFTEKAAGEMKLRLRDELDRARTAPELPAEERERLGAALAQLEVARIGTIHGFCADLLKEHPVEAGVDPLFEVCAEDEAQRLFDDAFEGWFQGALADPPEGVRRLLRRRPSRYNAPGPRQQLRDAAWSLSDHRDFTAAWRRDPWERENALDGAVAALASVAERYAGKASRSDDFLAQNIEKIGQWVSDLRRLEAVRGRDYDGLEAMLCTVLKWSSWRWTGGRSRPYGSGIERAEVVAARDVAKAEVERVTSAADADLAACLERELRGVIVAYELRKAGAGRLDFLDLLVRARDLVRGDAAESPTGGNRALRERLQGSIRKFFVDEFQDTDPLQAEILILLAADDPAEEDWTRAHVVSGKLFVVGDPKQSIYRFRRADVVLYREVVQRLVDRDGAELLHLTASFRAVPSIQTAVNAAFERAMAEGEGSQQAPYVPLTPFRAEIEGQPTVVALPVPKPYSDYGKITKWAIEASLPDAIAAFVHWLVTESGWKVESGGQRVAIAPRHVCILMKQFKSWDGDRTADVVKALEARRIPHVLVGGRSFHDREEVIAVRSALSAIEWPDDELSVYATLRGPFFALGDDALLAFRGTHGSLHPLRRIAAEALTDDTRPVAEALGILARLHLGRSRRPISDTLARLLEATRAHAGVAIWPRGEQALANVLRVMSVAQSFESRGTTSFRAFVEHLVAAAERAEAAEAPVVEEGTEGVRVMTVHKAKGLEFPVVVLGDPTTNEVQDRPSRWVDQARGAWLEPLAGCAPSELREHATDVLARDREEVVRLAYVAATRARDMLVVPVVGDADCIEGWLRPLYPAIYPASARRREASPAPGCPVFGKDTVLARPPQARDGRPPVVPGEHLPELGAHRVVFWDPARLMLEASADVGLRQQKILVADDGGAASDASIHAHDAWRGARAERLARGAAPTVAISTVTGVAKAGPPADLPAVELVAVDARRADRPRGPRFGSLVHATLAVVDLGADAPLVRDTALAQGRLLGAERHEIDAAAEAVVAALAHPLLARAARAEREGTCRREAPLVYPRGPGEVLEGVVDLAFEDATGWVVVDFKTDADLADKRAAYEHQVALYVQALAAVTERPARGVLLLV